jgi:hypothetical protein
MTEKRLLYGLIPGLGMRASAFFILAKASYGCNISRKHYLLMETFETKCILKKISTSAKKLLIVTA